MKLKFWKKEDRASLENPSTSLSDPAAWLTSWIGGTDTKAGAPVSAYNAITIPAVLAAVRLISESVASLPLHVYQNEEDGKRRVSGHPVNNVLGREANPDMAAFTLRETLMSHALLWGNGYAEIQRNRNNQVAALWPLLPDRTDVIRKDGVKHYLTQVNGETIRLRDRDVMHVSGLSYDGLKGYSPITLMRESLGLTIAAEEYGARMFSNNAKPGGILEHPGKLSPEAMTRLKESWASIHQGLSNAHRIAILEEGLTWKQQSMNPEDAQFLETRKLQKNEVATMFNVPPHMIGDLEKATFSNIEHQAIQFVVYTIRPWLVRWEQEINRKLFNGNYFAEHVVDGLLRGDIKSRYDAYAVGRQWGWLSANDIRKLENQNSIDEGDIYLTPMNMGDAANPQQQPEAPDEAERDYAPLIDDAMRRITQRENDRVRGILKRDSAETELPTFLANHRQYICDQLQPIADSKGKDIDVDSMAETHIRALEGRINDILTLAPEERAEAWHG